MITIQSATRISKRILLSNLLTNDYNLALTPLLSGRHGIGKSQVAKQIAEDIGGVCITIEGGTLKEGEITGIPYQYRNEDGSMEFRFLPYYAVRRIQEAEKAIGAETNGDSELETILHGTENNYASEDLTYKEKISMIDSGRVKPVILFFDEINRTDVTVFRELMNIILTRTVNGYRFPWWVFIIAAMNPSSQGSIYATNEMDPAQLDRFIKLKVGGDVSEWLAFAVENDIDQTLVEFIAGNKSELMHAEHGVEDTDSSKPSPRGWHMIDMILKGCGKIDPFFSSMELTYQDEDVRSIISAKVGVDAAAMYYASLGDPSRLIMAEDLFGNLDKKLPKDMKKLLEAQSTARNAVTTKSIIKFLKENIFEMSGDDATMKEVLARLSLYAKAIDDSSKLLFLTSVLECKLAGRSDLFDYVSDIVDDELMEILQYNNMNDILVAEKQHG